MKYALLIYGSPEARDAPEDELRSVVGEYDALLEEPAVLAGQQLQDTESATTVRVQNGEALLSDGPFVDAKEYLGGFLLLEADTSMRRPPWPRAFRRPGWAAPWRCDQSWSVRRAARRGLPQ